MVKASFIYRHKSGHRCVRIGKNEERKLAEQGTKFRSNSVEESHAYAWMLAHMLTLHEQTTSRHPLIKPRRGPYPYLSTHRHGSPRICVDHQPLPKSSHA
ncbi:hypothetical protein PIB30_098807 [Stylosanthes scabra]|uniref:Uncharacterized protein n=1 Tax=Stylosanthes scabra TaxID=79078 RepID=A0ABU6UW85_9FABA|nr:hypothetical protein [Stylosanthes scabra]